MDTNTEIDHYNEGALAGQRDAELITVMGDLICLAEAAIANDQLVDPAYLRGYLIGLARRHNSYELQSAIRRAKMERDNVALEGLD